MSPLGRGRLSVAGDRAGITAEAMLRTSRRSEIFAEATNPWSRIDPRVRGGWRLHF